MTYHPTSQLALARTRQQDLLDEAARRRLARTARAGRPGLRERVAALLRRRRPAGRRPQVATAAK